MKSEKNRCDSSPCQRSPEDLLFPLKSLLFLLRKLIIPFPPKRAKPILKARKMTSRNKKEKAGPVPDPAFFEEDNVKSGHDFC